MATMQRNGTGVSAEFAQKNANTPVSATDIANKAYVDAVAQGLSPKTSVVAATAAVLAAYTYANGIIGVGATITFTAVGAQTVDAVVPALGERVLVKNETAGNAPYNGIYTVTVKGTGGLQEIWTRSLDCDQSADFPGAFVFCESGTANTGAGFVCTNTAGVVVGTTAITWTQFSAGGAILANGTVAFTGNQSMGSHKLTSVADPTAAQDAATKFYVDATAIAVNTKWFAYAKANPTINYNNPKIVVSPNGVTVQPSGGAAEVAITDTTLGTAQGVQTTAGGGQGIELYPNGTGPITTGSYMQRQFKPYFRMRIKTPASLTSIRGWFGFFSGSPAASNDPAGLHLMAFRYAQGVDTNFMCCTKDGSTINAVSSGVLVAANTIYTLEMITNAAGNIEFYINGTLVYTSSSNLPTSSTTMGNIGYYGTATTAVQITMFWSDLYVSQN